MNELYSILRIVLYIIIGMYALYYLASYFMDIYCCCKINEALTNAYRNKPSEEQRD